MSQFVLTVDMPDGTLTPARPIANILRDAAAIIEMQMTPKETGQVLDPRGGNVLAIWTFGDAPVVNP